MLKEKLRDKIYPFYEQRPTDSLKDILDFEAKNYSERVAFSYRGENKEIVDKSVAEFAEEARNLAAYLNHKYKENKHIAIIGENSYEWILLFFAIVLSGNVAVAVDKDLSGSEIQNLLKISDTKDAFYSEKYCADAVKLKRVKLVEFGKIADLIEEGKKYQNKARLNKNKCAVIFFTSGTTGPNKAVMLSQKNIAADVYFASQNFTPGENAKTVAFLPFHHAFGLITAIVKPFYYHCPTLICSSLKTLMQDFKDYSPRVIFAVPQVVEIIYRQIWRTARSNGMDKKLKMGISISNQLKLAGLDARKSFFKSLHEQFGGELAVIICGGAYLDARYVKWFRNIGIEILVGYGITECSPVLAVNRNKYACDGSVGIPVHGCEVVEIDGEICARGDNVMLGYYKDKKATREVIDAEGYFHTGDLGHIDHNGFVFLTGRKKNLIILNNGENLSPEVVEAYFLHDKAVVEALAYASGNRIIVSVYPAEGFLGDQEYFDDLLYNYNKSVPKNHQVAMVRLRTEEFPKNNNRKILREKAVKEENER